MKFLHSLLGGMALLLLHEAAIATEQLRYFSKQWRGFQHVSPVKLNECSPFSPPKEDADGDGYVCGADIVLSKNYADDKITLTLNENKKPKQRTRYVIPNACVGPSEYSKLDLNRDKRHDFVITTNCSGAGIASYKQEILFVLSSATGYTVHQLETMPPFTSVLIGKTAKGSQFVHGQLLGTDSVVAGDNHNYWVYHLYEIQGSHVTLNKQPAAWVRYTYKNNDRLDTTLPATTRTKIIQGDHFTPMKVHSFQRIN